MLLLAFFWQYLSPFKLDFDSVKVKVGLLSLYNLTSYLFCQFSENLIQTKLAPASAELGTAQLQLVLCIMLEPRG